MTVTPVTSLAQFTEIINSGKFAVFDFYATWCGPCKAISPIFEKLSENADTEKIGFYKLDVDDVPDVAQEVGIRAMPTFILFKDGNKVKDLLGARPAELTSLVKVE